MLNLLNYIAYHKWNLVNIANYYINKLHTFSLCNKTEKKFFVYSELLVELEQYYKGCSCLTETEVCEILNLLNTI
jgi:hypothetical protein